MPPSHTKRVRDLDLGARFFMDGRHWTVSFKDNEHVEARESQFSTIRSFYDDVTAVKAGAYSSRRQVELAP